MKPLSYFTLTLIFAIAVLCPPAIAQKLLLSTGGSTTLGGLSIEKQDLVEYDTETHTATMLIDGSEVFTFEGYLSIEGAHRLQDGKIILSTNPSRSSATIGGVSFERNDLVEYDPSTRTATLYLDGDTLFKGSYIGNFDALYVLDDGSIVFSVFSRATIGGLDIDGNDIVRYDPRTQTAEVILDLDDVHNSSTGLRWFPGEVDALHILLNGNLVFSTSADLTIGSQTFGSEDLVEYNLSTGSATLFFDGSAVFPPTDLFAAADITAFSLVDGGSPPPPPPCTGGTIENPITIAVGQQLSCELNSTDPKLASGRHFKAFNLNSPGGSLSFNATSSAFTPRIGRRDPSDPSGNSFFIYPVPYSASGIPAGNFLFLLTSTDPARVGSFTLNITNTALNAQRSRQLGDNRPQDDFDYEVVRDQ